MPILTLSFKGRRLKVFPLVTGEMIIGSDPVCDIHIDSLAVDPRHGRLLSKGQGEVVLEDLDSRGGLFVNSERVREKALRDGDVIRIGKHTLSFSNEPGAVRPEEPPQPEPVRRNEPPKTAWLQILNGNNVGKTISLNRQMTNIGKPGVQTASIARRNDGFYLSHLEGESFPTVDGVEIGDRSWPLKDGAVIRVGNIKIQFYLQ